MESPLTLSEQELAFFRLTCDLFPTPESPLRYLHDEGVEPEDGQETFAALTERGLLNAERSGAASEVHERLDPVCECNARVSTDEGNAGWDTGTRPAPAYPNAWVRIKRVGNVLTAYCSADGVNWTQRATQDATQVGESNALPAIVYVGLCTTAHNNDLAGAFPLLYVNTVQYADFNPNFVPGPVTTTSTLSVALTGHSVTLSWWPKGGTLQSTPALVEPGVDWRPTPNQFNPQTIQADEAARFYRVR